MNLLRVIQNAGEDFCVGVKATCDDCKRYFSVRKPRRALRGGLSVLLLAAVLVSGCSSRTAGEDASGSGAESPGDESSSAVDTDSSSSSSSPAQPDVELLASATRFEPLQADALRSALEERSKTYLENPVFTPPAAGDINAWRKVNPDVIGWITISNTNINYPVVRTPQGQNNNYYNSLGYYKEPSKNGVIWTDMDTKFDQNGDFASTNTIIYGHNWTNCWRPVRVGNPADVMLAQIAAYDNADFAKQNPQIRIKTLGGDHIYQIFTVFYTDLSFKYYYAELPTPKVKLTMADMISQAKAKSIHQFDVPVSANDKIITISTCTRIMGPGDNQRFVIMAKQIS